MKTQNHIKTQNFTTAVERKNEKIFSKQTTLLYIIIMNVSGGGGPGGAKWGWEMM